MWQWPAAVWCGACRAGSESTSAGGATGATVRASARLLNTLQDYTSCAIRPLGVSTAPSGFYAMTNIEDEVKLYLSAVQSRSTATTLLERLLSKVGRLNAENERLHRHLDENNEVLSHWAAALQETVRELQTDKWALWQDQTCYQ